MATIQHRIHKRTNDETWTVSYRGTKHDGTYGQASRTFPDQAVADGFHERFNAAGEAAAFDFLRQLHEAAEAAGAVTVDGLAEAYLTWLTSRVKSDRTIADYRTMYANHIKPTFGHRGADLVDDGDVQDWIDGIDRAPKTVAGFHALLSGMYGWGCAARGKRIVKINPCQHTDLPPRSKRKARGLRPGEWAMLYQAAGDTYPDCADLLLFLVGSGWRWSEAAALEVSQIDDDGERVVVDMDAVMRRQADGKVVRVSGAKSEAGERSVTLSPLVAQMIRRRVRGKALNDRVFTNPSGGAWRYSNFLNRFWARNKGQKQDKRPRILERAFELGLARTPTIHWLRHTHVFLMLRTGEANLAEIQKRVGHATIGTTIDTYGSMVDDVSDDALAALDRQLTGRVQLRAVQ